MFRASRKVQGGKLVRVEIETLDDKISKMKITGDFFLHPEERLGQFEQSLVGMLVLSSVKDFQDKLEECVRTHENTSLYGVSLKDVVETMVEALNSAEFLKSDI